MEADIIDAAGYANSKQIRKGNNMGMVELTSRLSSSPNHNFVKKMSLKRVTWKTDIIDDAEIEKCSVSSYATHPIVKNGSPKRILSNKSLWIPLALPKHSHDNRFTMI